VELVGSFLTIKYLYKYVHKGVNVGTVAIKAEKDDPNKRDEINRFINARTIDAHDAHWRTMEYKIQDRFPAVQTLAVHEEGQQNILFRDGKAEQALNAAKDTTLIAFFKLNSSHPDPSKYLYREIPEHYTWSSTTHEWKKRKKQPDENETPRTIGRINNVSPLQGERF
jgi:hypothetical protein